MRGCVHRRKTAMPRVRARGIAENKNIASRNLSCEKGRPPARAGGIAF
jgi:hypothetical protein